MRLLCLHLLSRPFPSYLWLRQECPLASETTCANLGRPSLTDAATRTIPPIVAHVSPEATEATSTDLGISAAADTAPGERMFPEACEATGADLGEAAVAHFATGEVE